MGNVSHVLNKYGRGLEKRKKKGGGMKMDKNINWNWILIEILLIFVIVCGLLATGFAYKINILANEPQWNARVCFEEYDDCWNVNFLEQQHFVDFCEKGNGWYQISSTTTCILNSETLSMVKP